MFNCWRPLLAVLVVVAAVDPCPCSATALRSLASISATCSWAARDCVQIIARPVGRYETYAFPVFGLSSDAQESGSTDFVMTSSKRAYSSSTLSLSTSPAIRSPTG